LKFFKWLFFILLALVFIVIMIGSFGLNSEAFLNQSAKMAIEKSGLDIKFGEIKGGLYSGLEIKDFNYQDDVKADMIVFNPPWLPAKHNLEEGIDKAMYYEEELFPRFFEQAIEHLAPEGKIVLIFSNLAEVVDGETMHPIIEELQKNKRFRKELHLRRDVRASSRRTKRRDSRDTEKVELWVLSAKK